jgi:hypothetical protein
VGDKGLDLKHVNAPGGEVNPAQITGYIAKYVTKSTEVASLNLRSVDDLLRRSPRRPGNPTSGG